MSRRARKFSESGLYHIIFRGINHQTIFEEDQDYAYMHSTTKHLQEKMDFQLYAYCYMPNHVHLLLRETKIGDISQIMRRLLTKYVLYFNKKYQRSGILIGNRYKSKPVEEDNYLIPLAKYIHQNPLKAGIVRHPGEYKYSSYNAYAGVTDEIVSTGLLMNMIDKQEFLDWHQFIDSDESLFEVSTTKKLTKEEVRHKIIKELVGCEPWEIGTYEREERNRLLCQLKSAGLSISEIERATGISRGVIWKS